MKSALEIQNSLLWMIITLYAFRCVTFWFKASGLHDWYKEGIAREEAFPVLSSVMFFIGLVCGVFAFIHHYVRWISTP